MDKQIERLSVKKLASYILLIQLAVICVISVFFYLAEKFFGLTPDVSSSAGFSAFVGGMIYLIPFTVYTILSIGRNLTNNFVALVLFDFIVSFILKFVLVIGLFFVVFKYIPTVHYIVFISFSVLFVTQWIALIVLNSRY